MLNETVMGRSLEDLRRRVTELNRDADEAAPRST